MVKRREPGVREPDGRGVVLLAHPPGISYQLDRCTRRHEDKSDETPHARKTCSFRVIATGVISSFFFAPPLPEFDTDRRKRIIRHDQTMVAGQLKEVKNIKKFI